MLGSAALRAHTADLSLVVRHVLAGLGHGLHAGRERGAGVEFSEYRAYAPGDEWRRVDWKLLARADRYYVREAERDSHVAVWLLLDATASMAEPSRSRPELDKLAFARTLLACVAAVAQRQGDAFGLLVIGDGRIAFTPAARGPRQLQRVLAQLSRVRAAGRLPDADALQAGLHFAGAPGLVFAVSDGLDWPSPLSHALLRLRRMRHDVRLLCLHTQAELDADFAAGIGYREREPEKRAETQAKQTTDQHTGPQADAALHSFDSAARAAYRSAHAAHFDALLADCRRNDLPVLSAPIEQPFGTVLRAWLQQAGRR
jgi:uncharacterized protein (DUF58 family)